MIVILLYVVLAILGLSVLIFIHEFGHYWMARREGMRVETFSIGFGKPIATWMRDGVKWQIGWLLFGGFVKIAGQEIEKDTDPYSVPDGFFGKSPLARIKVAFMGPFVNIVFAFIVFALLWAMGGREKNFSDFTRKIGWVDPHSELYALGVRPGDEIEAYDDHVFQGAKDNIVAPMMAGDEVSVKGYKVDYATGVKHPFSYRVKTYSHPSAADKGVKTAGIIQSANYLIYDKYPGSRENPLVEGSPMKSSGIKYGDRILWVDGEAVFSGAQLSHLLNDGRCLLTILRNGVPVLRRVPRVLIQELKLSPQIKEELTDWQFEAHLTALKLPKLYAIPYDINNEGVVEGSAKFIDNEKEAEFFHPPFYSTLEEPLEPGDKIIAIDGTPVKHSYELLAKLQEHLVNIIVERNPDEDKKVRWTQADQDFNGEMEWSGLQAMASSIGTEKTIRASGNLILLNKVKPKTPSEFYFSPERQAMWAAEMLEQKKRVESIEDPDKRAREMHQLQTQQKLLLLGVAVQDRKVDYNPEPLELLSNTMDEFLRMPKALFTGTMSPKWLSGPIGIVQVVMENSMVSLKESLFWFGFISLNLGMLNLLPIPVLDGGTILICLVEMITRKKMSPRVMEKIVIPFAVAIIAFFVFVTYHDVLRVFSRFLPW